MITVLYKKTWNNYFAFQCCISVCRS